METKIIAKTFAKQEEFLRMVGSRMYDFILYGGAIRGGKTFVLLILFLMLSSRYPGSRWVIIRKDLERVKTTVLPVFQGIFPAENTTKYPSSANGWEWHHRNGSVIKFFGENRDKDPDLLRFRGLECDGIGLEEMDITEECFNKCFERVGTWRMGERKAAKKRGEKTPPVIVVGTSNPQEGFVKERIFNPWRDGTLNERWAYLSAKLNDNPYVDQEYKDRLKANMLPDDYDKYVVGDWDVNINKKPFFWYYNDQKHFTNKEFEIDNNHTIWITFDFNYDPCTCSVHQFYDGKAITLREVEAIGGTQALCDKIDTTDIVTSDLIMWNITGDHSGLSKSSTSGNVNDFEIIKNHFGLGDHQFVNIHTKNRGHEYSRKLCNFFMYKIPWQIDSRCTTLRKDLKKAKPDKSGKLYKNRDKGHAMDMADNFRYVIDAVFPKGIDDINLFI